VTTAELTVVAALGASFLTALASLGVVAFQEWRRRKARDREVLQAAVNELLSRSLQLAFRADTMRATMKLRSGLKEGLDVVMRNRKPVDSFELHDWMAQDWAPLNSALSQIWISWDQEGIRLANDVAGKAGELLGVRTAATPAGSAWDRVRIWAAGERWTPEMIADAQRALKDLAHARKHLAEYARRMLGQPGADLFAQVTAEDAGAAVAVPAGQDPTQPAAT
jgi:hypothetical protein